MKKTMLILSIALTFCGHLLAQQSPSDSLAANKPDKSVTRHSIKIDGKLISYTAIAGTMVLKNEKDEQVALVGYTAYIKDTAHEAGKRPLTFAYNGGPGSSSMWLHMGALGPKHVVTNDAGLTGPPPYKTEDNIYSVLDVTDLIMIDPVGTGLSHAIGKAANKDFWGVDQDIKYLSLFIKQMITAQDRWNSPKYILGESYGTTRSAGIADYLQDNLGIQLNGVILVSVVLDFRTLIFLQGDDISYSLYLPTYAAVAWYHNKLANKPGDLESFLKEVRAFAGGEYLSALQKGDDLGSTERDAVLTKLVAYTGLSKDYWMKAQLRVNQPQFTQELLRDGHETIGRLDARYKGINQDLLSEYSTDDPQSSQISPAYIASFMNYFYGDLKVDKKYDYHVNAYTAEGFKWDWNHAKNGNNGDPILPNTGVDLAAAMSKNPNLKVLVLNGYYDLATPFFATEFTFNHLGLEPKIRSNVSFKYYPGGHMMYVNPSCLATMKKDMADFIVNSSK
jgi:carboxypeptidase C (cathepsin A)